MLVIKKAQIEHFIANDDTQLVQVISEIIREIFVETIEDYADETIRSMVEIGIKKAKSYGFERAEDIAAFVAIMIEISPNFDTHKTIHNVLTNRNIANENKFYQLMENTDEETWAKAEKTYDVKLWFPEN